MGKDRKVNIYVKPNPDPTGKDPYLFSMDEGKGATDELEFDKTKDNMKKSENYSIEFQLQNQDGAALRFSKDPLKVLWAKPVSSKSDPCPSSDCYMDEIFYLDPNETIKDHKVTVINTDPDVQLFKFAFNFLPPGESDPPPSGYVWYDPIGSNQNGGLRDSLGGGTAAMTIGGAVAGAAASLLFSTSATTQSLVMWAVAGAVIGFLASLILGGRQRQSLQG